MESNARVDDGMGIRQQEDAPTRVEGGARRDQQSDVGVMGAGEERRDVPGRELVDVGVAIHQRMSDPWGFSEGGLHCSILADGRALSILAHG